MYKFPSANRIIMSDVTIKRLSWQNASLAHPFLPHPHWLPTEIVRLGAYYIYINKPSTCSVYAYIL